MRWQGADSIRTGSRLLVAVTVALLFLGECSLRPPSTHVAEPGPATPAAPEPVEVTRRPRVLIVGDSIADQLGSHALPALRQAGIDARLSTWWGWSLLTREQYDMGATVADPPDDAMIEVVTQDVAEHDPDVVAVYVNHNYWPPYPRDVAGREIAYSSPELTAMARTQLTELVRRVSAHGADVYLIKPIPGRDGTADRNPIWSSYLSLRDELGFGVIDAGDAAATASGERLDRTTDCAGRPVEVRAIDRIHLSYHGAGLVGTRVAQALAEIVGVSLDGANAVTEAPAAMLPVGSGYRLVTCDGSTYRANQGGPNLGGAHFDGGRAPTDPVVAATTADHARRGWVVTRTGQVGTLGDAPHHGELGDAADLDEGETAVGIAGSVGGRGYWIATSRGDVRAFGDAGALGDLDLRHGEAVVGMAGTPDRRGIWLLTSRGRVVAFGSAERHGDLAGQLPAAPLTAIAAQANGDGYWILDREGNVHPFGTASQHGSPSDQVHILRITGWEFQGGEMLSETVPGALVPASAVTMLSTASGGGYWIWLDNGAVCHFGDATVGGGLHRAHIDTAMRLQGLPFYGLGPCSQQPGDPLAPPDEVYAPASG